MEKGHYGDYTGNSRHSRKEEMIHDRELISDAKKQLHSADKDYKQDSPAKRALVGDQDKLPEEVKLILCNMMYNLGYTRLSKFSKLKLAVNKGDWESASKEMHDSKWRVQVPNRAERLISRMKAVGA